MPGVKRNAVHFSPVQFDSQKQKMSSSDTFTQLANQLAAIGKQMESNSGTDNTTTMQQMFQFCTTLLTQMAQQQNLIMEQQQTIQKLQMRDTLLELIEDEKQQKSVVITNLPESNCEHAKDRVAEDFEQVKEILDLCDVECKPSQVYRMGTIAGRPRLLKVELPTRFFARKFLLNKSKLKNSKFNNLFVRKSLSKAQRAERSRLIEICKTLHSQNPKSDHVIYADHVLSAKDIPLFKSNPNNFKCVCHNA
ncbi:unnamed protein product [Meloidogyne enterolobii]|uniref:Uncharacterized protein n=1 Tax=Meloidogyne enterolobii TaxID=390850 RepID=A0ACB0XQP2_MELEN